MVAREEIKIRRPKSEIRKKSECQSPSLLTRQAGPGKQLFLVGIVTDSNAIAISAASF
jgi:hypothetical protein